MPAKKHDEMHQIYLQSERDLADLRARYEDAEVFKQKYTEYDFFIFECFVITLQLFGRLKNVLQ